MLNEKKLIKTLFYIASSLIVANIINELIISKLSWQINRFVNLGLESNFPTWFSSMLLALASLYAYKCSFVSRKRKGEQKIWQLFALVLLGMSCDEVAMIHESIGSVLNKYVFNFGFVKHSPWVLLMPFILLAIIILAVYIKRSLTGSFTAIRFLAIGGTVYIFGGFVCESTINFLNHENLEWLWRIENILEESCEMFGVIIIIMGIIEHRNFLRRTGNAVQDYGNFAR